MYYDDYNDFKLINPYWDISITSDILNETA
jgi:hypothetical protein